MYKIILADDNALIRMGMKCMIRWKELNAELVGEVCDGDEALDLLKKKEADLLITDIRMPGKDGLALINEVKNLYPRMETIIISAYNEFAYAKEALKAGSMDYILKPIDPEEMNLAIQKAIKRKKVQEPQNSELELGVMPAVIFLRTEKEYTVGKIQEILQKYSPVNIKKENIYFILSFDGSRYSADWILSVLQKEMNGKILFGKAVSKEKSVKDLLEEAKKDAGKNFLKKPDVKQAKAEKVPQNIEDLIILCKSGSSENAKAVCRKKMQQILKQSMEDITIWQKNMEHFMGSLLSIETQDDCGLQEVLRKINRQKEEFTFIDLQEVDKEVEKCIESLCDCFSVQHGGKQKIVKEVQKYIEQCYSKELSLAGIASKLHILAPYLSRIFKEESGKNLNQYITEIRIRKAQYILENSNKKIVEVAKLVGYDDVNYFTKVYKKVTGKTPTKDRKM